MYNREKICICSFLFLAVDIQHFAPPMQLYISSYRNIVYVIIITLFMDLYTVSVIMRPTSDCIDDSNDDSNNTNSVIFIVLFTISVLIIILLIIIIIYLVVKVRKTSYSPNHV